MRTIILAAVPFFLAAAPTRAQVSVGVHINVPVISHPSRVDHYRSPGRVVYVNAYPPVPYGQWKKHYRNWHRTTLYVVGNRYYDTRVRGGRPVVVYRDRDRYFWGPQDGNWARADRSYRGGRDDQYGRGGQYDRDDRGDRYDRDDRNGSGRGGRSNGR